MAKFWIFIRSHANNFKWPASHEYIYKIKGRKFDCIFGIYC
jgi:hypothetical protein